MRAWYARNREKEIARSTKWNKENKKCVAANMQKCRKRRPRHFLLYAREYWSKNYDRARIHDHNKRAKKLGIEGRLVLSEWLSIKDMFCGRCFYCGTLPLRLTIDHLVCFTKGGKNFSSNIVPACKSCNSKKYNFSPKEFLLREVENVRSRVNAENSN